MKGVGTWVILKPKDGVMRQSKSGLDVPTAMSDRFLQAEIIHASESVGKEEYGLEGGQTVLYDKNSGFDFPDAKGEIYRIVRCSDIAVIL